MMMTVRHYNVNVDADIMFSRSRAWKIVFYCITPQPGSAEKAENFSGKSNNLIGAQQSKKESTLQFSTTINFPFIFEGFEGREAQNPILCVVSYKRLKAVTQYVWMFR